MIWIVRIALQRPYTFVVLAAASSISRATLPRPQSSRSVSVARSLVTSPTFTAGATLPHELRM